MAKISPCRNYPRRNCPLATPPPPPVGLAQVRAGTHSPQARAHCNGGLGICLGHSGEWKPRPADWKASELDLEPYSPMYCPILVEDCLGPNFELMQCCGVGMMNDE